MQSISCAMENNLLYVHSATIICDTDKMMVRDTSRPVKR